MTWRDPNIEAAEFKFSRAAAGWIPESHSRATPALFSVLYAIIVLVSNRANFLSTSSAVFFLGALSFNS